MTQGDHMRLVEVISAERFQPFLDECGGDQDQAIRLYAWDSEVARALQSPLRDLEVALRNRVHNQLGGRYGQSDWWNVRRAEPNRHGLDEIDAAEQKLARRKRTYDTCDVVAQLSFGFWVGLLGKGGRGGNYEMKYWNPSLRHLFREHRGGRETLHSQFDRMRTLRNRIAHQERIFHRHLDQDFRTAVALLRHLSVPMAERHDKHSQVPEVLARKSGVLSGGEPVRL
ncbi:Abi family protein [Streptomyces sp. NPDC101117]|uniref:Abi family protein n=1 Tax=Streptomyces sp. NPDC101117 TaxID=3366108 RepID=UPI0038203016